MNGKTHVIYGFLVSILVFAGLSYLALTIEGLDFGGLFGIPALLMFGGGTILGAMFPDYDILLAPSKQRLKLHRNTLTHSSIIPVAATIAYAFTDDITARVFLLFICVGMATHLWFDMFISDVEGMTFINRWGKRLFYFFQGNVGGTFKGSGHKWANQHKRAYLIIHATICMICAGILFWGIYNGITITGWFW